jgi:hypothetical protein
MNPIEYKLNWSQKYSLSGHTVQYVIDKQEKEMQVDCDLDDSNFEEANALIALIKSRL